MQKDVQRNNRLLGWLRARGSGTVWLVFVIVAVGATVSQVFEVWEDRRAAADASALRVAALEVASADALKQHGHSVNAGRLTRSVETLRQPHDLALHAMESEDRVRTVALLAQIAECGVMLLTPGEDHHDVHDHDELGGLLDRAVERSEQGAASAERRASWSVLGLLTALAGGLTVVLRRRRVRLRGVIHAEALARAGERLTSLLNDSPDGLIVVDRLGVITYRSASAAALLGEGATHRDSLVQCASSHDRARFEHHLVSRRAEGGGYVLELTGVSGHTGWFEVRVSDLTADPSVDGWLVTLRDVSAEVRMRQELERQAQTDVLTGLPNRRILGATVATARSSLGDGSLMSVTALDVDGFKAVNDTLGHVGGDRLLRQISVRLAHLMTENEVLSRVGGDEFAVVALGVRSPEAIRTRAEQIAGAFDAPFRIGDRAERIHVSVGVAATDDPAHADDLLAEADVALQQVKRRGGNSVAVYDLGVDAAWSRSSRIIRALHEVDYDSEFRLVYQPIVHSQEGRLVCLEALLRWDSPRLGCVPPGEFIPIAEEVGEIGRIGWWVLERVCEQVARWDRRGLDPTVTVSFNVSPHQLVEDGFVRRLLDVVDGAGVDPRRLTVEVTESATVEPDGLAVSRLHALREAGLRVAIDDFGSGYSNLGQLMQVPFDAIKVDRSLLLTLSAMREQAGGDPTAPCSIMEAIVTIARTLQAPVVCEGVESEVQRLSLERSGVDFMQGYLTGRPQTPADLEGRLGLAPVAGVAV